MICRYCFQETAICGTTFRKDGKTIRQTERCANAANSQKDQKPPLPSPGMLDSSRYLSRHRFGPQGKAQVTVMRFCNFTDAELYRIARSVRNWPAGAIDSFGFAPACAERLKGLMNGPAPEPESEPGGQQ